MRVKLACIGAIATLVGCGDIIGLDGFTDLDASVEATAPVDAAAEMTHDAPSNGWVDASACGDSSVCVPALPSGWSWAVYDQNARSPCATAYTAPKNVDEGIDAAPAKCSCTCTTTAPNCTTGTITITAGATATCDDAITQTATANSGNCAALTAFTTGVGSKVSVTGSDPSGGGCNASLSEMLPTIGYAHQGRTCAYAGDAGATCGSASVCMPNPSPFLACVSKAGSQPCPSGFPQQHIVGSKITDGRNCSSCGCTFNSGTCTGTATLYTNAGCSAGQTAVPADGTCANVGAHSFRAYDYVPKSNATCSASATSPSGAVTFSDETTICCQ